MASKARKTLNSMLLAKGFDPMAEKIGTVLDVEGKEYIVKETKGKRYFEEYVADSDDELVEEEYEVAQQEAKQDSEWVEADPKPLPVKKMDITPPQKELDVQEPEPKIEPEPEPGLELPAKTTPKPRGRKPKNPDKPKRTREPTEYNKFVKDVMVQVVEMYPDMNNNDRMRECSKLWQKAKADKQNIMS